jgi:cellulose synthase/poly-beta-1,6-N-acetylglucosamine synthase-like glycosyltransferase
LTDPFYHLAYLAIFLYGCFLMFLFVYSLVQLGLAIQYVKMRMNRRKKPQISDADLPVVTIQLPVYNELYVIERLIDAVCAFDYPLDKLEIQVLDDSTDESFEVAAKKIAEKQKLGIDIKHVKRPERKGFKAGALAYGLDICRGEFTAIFDADFVPRRDFLRQTVPFFFVNENIGVVQTRWEHLNEDYSLLTRLQAFGLDAHFTVEQIGRNTGQHFINFNGTAGIWRKKTIYDAGGWESDTITEDLDLSYRAQLKNWEFIYLPEIGSPSELPAEMNALKAQQFRWTKGAAECTIKNLPKVLNATHLTFGQKVHGAFHLMNSVVFLCILGTSLLSVPMLIIKNTYGDLKWAFIVATCFLVSFFFLGFFYWVSRPDQPFFQKMGRFIVEYPAFLSVSMGLSLHNAVAVMEGFTGKKSAFVRTPKFAISGKKAGTWTDKKYRAVKISPLTVFEFLMACYFIWGLTLAFKYNDFGLFIFHSMLTIGYLFVTVFSIKHARA